MAVTGTGAVDFCSLAGSNTGGEIASDVASSVERVQVRDWIVESVM
jgi:hypothetical protein